MIEWATSFIETVGYPGIVVLMILEILIPLIQSEIVMTFSGFTASRGELNVFLVVLAGVTGSQVGSLALFAVCRWAPEDRVIDFLDQYGGWLGFGRANLESGRERFRRHDQWAVLIGRLLPGLRSFIAVPAGFSGLSYGRFFLLNLLGTAFWVSVLTYLGTVLGKNYTIVDQYSSTITYALLGAVVVYVLFRAARVVKHHIVAD